MATVTGTILEPNGSATQRVPVRFQLVETVSVSSSTYPREWVEAKTDTSGAFSITLVAGDYIVSCKGEEFKIAVPAGASSYNIADITTDGVSFPSTLASTFGFFSVATLAELITIPTRAVNKLAVVRGGAAENDGGGGTFWWDSTGTSADDVYLTRRPTDYTSAGIWRRANDGLHSLKWFGGNGGGSTNNYAALTSGFATVDTLTVPPGTYRLSTNFTVASGKNLILAKGAVFSIDSGITLTVSGTLSAGLWQVFSGSGSVALGNKVRDVHPEWWGAVGDDSTDNTTAFESAFASAPLNGRVVPGGGTFIIDSCDIARDVSLCLSAHTTLKMKANATGSMLNYTANQSGGIYGPGTIDGNQANQAGATWYAVVAPRTSTKFTIRDVTFQNCAYAAVRDIASTGHLEVAGCLFRNASEHGGVTTTKSSLHLWFEATQSNTRPHLSVHHCRFVQDSYPSAAGASESKAPGGILVSGNSSLSARPSCDIAHNHFSKIGQTYLLNHLAVIHTYEDAERVNISDNIIDEPLYVAISCQNASRAIIKGNIITGNPGNGAAGGSAIWYDPTERSQPELHNTATISDNTIYNLDAQIGIFIWAPEFNAKRVSVHNNTITGCLSGVQIRGVAGTSTFTAPLSVRGNVIEVANGPGLRLENLIGVIRVADNDVRVTGHHAMQAVEGLTSARFHLSGNYFETAASGSYALIVRGAAACYCHSGQYANTGASGVAVTFGADASANNLAVLLFNPYHNIISAGTTAYTQAEITRWTGLLAGTGTPEGVYKASVGDALFMNFSGGAGTTLYVKSSGLSGNTGWSALS